MYTDDCSLTALFIDRLFPHLQTLASEFKGSEPTWKRVTNHVRICQEARRQQAQRIAALPLTKMVARDS